MFVPGTQRSFCAVSHLYNVTRPSGAKNNRKTKIGCYLATQMKISIIPSSHSGRGQSQRRAEGDSMPTRGESGGHLAISHRSGYWESRKQSVDGNTMAYSIPGETNEAATWSPPPQVQVQTEQGRFLMKFLLATEIVFLLRECTEEGLCRPQAPSAIQRRVML